MVSAGDVINFVKTDQRIVDNAPPDATLLMWLNKNLVRRTRSQHYPNLLVEGTTFTTTSGTYAYALPAGFFKLVPNSVQYNVQSPNAGMSLPEVDYQQAEAWRIFNQAATPAVCMVAAGTNGTKKLELLPTYTESGKVVQYDYFAAASTFTSTASTAQVPELLEVLAYDTIADYCRYDNRPEEAEDARRMAQGLYREANRGMIT